MRTPVVRVVIPSFNGRHLLGPCLDSLVKVDWPRESLEVVVVDNGSTDGTAEWLDEAYPWVRVHRNGTNLGFAAGNNSAMRDLDGVDYVALLNNDAAVDPGWLRPLVAALQDDPRAGAANSKIVFAPRFVELAISSPTFTPARGDSRTLGVKVSGVIVDGRDRLGESQFVSGFYGNEIGVGEERAFQWTMERARLRVPASESDPPRCMLRLAAEREKTVNVAVGLEPCYTQVGPEPHWVDVRLEGTSFDVVNNVGSILVEGGYGADRGFLEPDTGQYEEPAEVFAWCGCSVLLCEKYLASVGLFDDDYFMYYEDFDLAWRGRAQGWRYVYVPESVVRHVHAASSIEGSDLWQRFVDRNRLLTLVKNAPASLVGRAVYEYARATLSYARRDVVAPVLHGHRPTTVLLRRRARALGAFAKRVPRVLAQRRQLRRRQIVRDDELLAWTVVR